VAIATFAPGSVAQAAGTGDPFETSPLETSPPRQDPCDPFLQSPAPFMLRGRAEFLERNYFFYNVPAVGPAQNQPLFFEPQIAPHLFFYNGLAKLPSPSRCDTFLQSYSLSFISRFRMVGDWSTPVRPPSYMPRLNYQMFWVRRMDRLTPEGRPFRPPKDAIFQMLEVRLSLGHHSNGQQYCRYDPTMIQFDPASTCQDIIPSQVVADRPRLNVRSGDFSTDYYQVAAHFANLWLDGEGREHVRLSGGLSFEGNPKSWGFDMPGRIDPAEYATYGPYRFGIDATLGWHNDGTGAERALVAAWMPRWLAAATGAIGKQIDHATFRLDPSFLWFPWNVAPGVASHRLSIEASWTPDWWNGVGLFARYFQGQDYMNILYLEGPVHTVQLGLIWDQSPQIAYKIQPRRR
jgi:hypothetical protein